MSLRSIRFRIDAFPQILLAAALTAAAGAAQASHLGHRFARADAGAGRACADTQAQLRRHAAAGRHARRHARRHATPESATPAGTGALPPHPGAGRRARARVRGSRRNRLPAAAYRRAGSAPAPTAVPAATAAPAATADPVVIMPTAEDTKACLDKLRKGATANGLTLADWDKYTAGAKLLPTTVSSAKGQPEGRESWWDYIAKTVDDGAWPTAR